MTAQALAGRVAIVTGGSRGVGKGIAEELGAAGATVCVTGRSRSEGEGPVVFCSPLPGTVYATAESVSALGGKGIAVPLDHRDDIAVTALFAQVEREQGRLDLLVNHAYLVPEALFSGRPFWEMPLSVWDDMTAVGARSHYVAAVYAARCMVRQGRGLIVSTSSPGGGNFSITTAYGAGKAAVDKMASDMAHELRPHGVAVLSLWLGLVSTERAQVGAKHRGMADISRYETPRFVGRGVVALATDPEAEIFDEAWRVNRDYFYDPGMHGVDWMAVKKKYAVFLPDLACRDDLNLLIQWMGSELSIGHHRITNPGDYLYDMKPVNGGLLGADYETANGRYRLKKIYGGLNWNPKLRSPLTEPGVNAKVGDYLLAVNGQEVRAEDNLYKYFENTSGKIVELTIGPNADGSGSRVVKVVPVNNEFALRNRDWVEGNLRKVTEATKGKVAYVYVPNTAQEGHDYFKRYFFPQVDRQAIIVDERFNGGGDLADYYIELLTRPHQAYWHTRYGMDFKSPVAQIEGPKVMLIDETAGSGGDMLPWMFHKFNVGTIIGKRTWGGLVGILGYPAFLDGGGVTAPNVGIWTKDGFVVENVGVSPDIEVEQTPADVIRGRDPQLEKAIQVAMQQLAEHPVLEEKRPAMPVIGH